MSSNGSQQHGRLSNPLTIGHLSQVALAQILDPMTDTGDEGSIVPWHCRYLSINGSEDLSCVTKVVTNFLHTLEHNWVGIVELLQEFERADSELRCLSSTQTCLVIDCIQRYGSEQQRSRYLPELVQGQSLKKQQALRVCFRQILARRCVSRADQLPSHPSAWDLYFEATLNLQRSQNIFLCWRRCGLCREAHRMLWPDRVSRWDITSECEKRRRFLHLERD